MGDINVNIKPSADVDVEFADSSDLNIKFHPGSALSINVPSDARGNDVAADGRFDTACGVIWTCGTGWTITGGKAVATAATGNLLQAPLVIGESYEITYTISDYVGGIVRMKCGSGTNGTPRAANGTYTETLVCSGSTGLIFDGVVAFTGKLDNVTAYLL